MLLWILSCIRRTYSNKYTPEHNGWHCTANDTYAFSCIRIVAFNSNLTQIVLKVQWTITWYCFFREWISTKQVQNYYLDQWWLFPLMYFCNQPSIRQEMEIRNLKDTTSNNSILSNVKIQCSIDLDRFAIQYSLSVHNKDIDLFWC